MYLSFQKLNFSLTEKDYPEKVNNSKKRLQ